MTTVFFLIAYGVMWTCFATVAAAHIPAASPLGFVLLYLGTFAPALSAISVTAIAGGRAGVRALFAGAFRTPAAAWWFVFAVAYMPAIKLTAALIHRVALGMWPRFGTEPLILIPLAIAISTPVQIGEELGWRGFALPRMSAAMGPRSASLVLGLLWAFWHLPQFFIPEADTYSQSFVIFVLQVIAMSVAMAWLYQKASGNLWPLMVMHDAVNNTKDIVPSATPGGTATFGFGGSPVAWITVALLWTCAIVLLVRMPRERRSSNF